MRSIKTQKGLAIAALLLQTASLAACSKKEEPATKRVAPPTASSEQVPSDGSETYRLASGGNASFLIDAPLEKIKGRVTNLRGHIELHPSQLAATRGEIDVDLDSLKTTTFDDVDKNAKQTEHSHNWLELGNDVDPKEREENRWARFSLRNLQAAGVTKLSDVALTDGQRTLAFTAEGEFWLHGVSVRKTVRLSVAFRGGAEAPTELEVKTLEPLGVSLREHDVKPRDVAGKFLQGALEKVGQKIDDKVQITLKFTAKR